MPVVRLCPYCKKGFLKSTYQMFEHVKKCEKYKSIIDNVNNDKSQKSLKKETPLRGYEIKPDIIFSCKSQRPE